MNGRILVETQDRNNLGTHHMVLFVDLPQYSVTLDVPFKIIIEACVVYDIHVTHPRNLHLFYSLGGAPLLEPIPDAFLTPSSCGQNIIYTLFDQNTGVPAPFAELDVPQGVFRIFSEDTSIGGVYYLTLRFDAEGDSTATPVDVVYKVTIDVCPAVTIEETY